jgi:hypothetical protein
MFEIPVVTGDTTLNIDVGDQHLPVPSGWRERFSEARVL